MSANNQQQTTTTMSKSIHKKPSGKEKRPKKVRARNFTNDEVELIMRLAGKKSKVLTARLSATVTSDRKNLIWKRIADTVNAANGQNDRGWQECRKKWHGNISSARTKLRDNVHQRKKTGGGPSEERPLNVLEQMAVDSDMISTVQVEGICGGFDSNVRRIELDNERGIDSPQTQQSLNPVETAYTLTTVPETYYADMEVNNSPNLSLPPQMASQSVFDSISQGLRAVYGSTVVRHKDSIRPEDSESELDSDASTAIAHQSFRTLDDYENSYEAETEDDEPPAVTPKRPLKSNRTVTRDLRRSEFKELLECKHKMNEHLSETNTVLRAILGELQKFNK